MQSIDKHISPMRRKDFAMRRNVRILHAAAKALLFFSIFIFIWGCGGAPRSKHYMRENFDIENVKKIAVLPMENFTENVFAAERIRKAVISEILSRGVDVIEPGEVTKTLSELKVKSLGHIAIKDIEELGKKLGVEAVMVGAVEHYGTRTGVTVSFPEVSIDLRLVETASGNIVWSIWHTSGGPGFWTRHFGAEGRSLSDSARKVVKEAVDRLFY